MKRYRVRLAEDAELDLADIYRHIVSTDSKQQADDTLDELESACTSLARMPLRGHVPAELDRIGVASFREIHVKPWRIIYETVGAEVLVHGIFDGRRDMQSLLERRLLR